MCLILDALTMASEILSKEHRSAEKGRDEEKGKDSGSSLTQFMDYEPQ